jgi:hypothetical protein
MRGEGTTWQHNALVVGFSALGHCHQCVDTGPYKRLGLVGSLSLNQGLVAYWMGDLAVTVCWDAS